MLGKLVADSGAAQRITTKLVEKFGKKNIQWAVVLTGFIVGIPMFYSVGFVILIPLVFTIAAATGLPLLYVGLPMLASLSVTHGYLPPHPAPTAIAATFNADIGKTLLYGIFVAIPAIIVGGPLLSRTMKNIKATPLLEQLTSQLAPLNLFQRACRSRSPMPADGVRRKQPHPARQRSLMCRAYWQVQ